MGHNRDEGKATFGDSPSIRSALADASRPGSKSTELIEMTDSYAVVKLHFSEPKLSESGNSYVCGFGAVGQGSLKVNVLAYIPIPRKDRRDAARR